MNIENSSEASSSGGREDGDASSNERPLKKARFAWQIKGKYHLRNKTNQPTESSADTVTESETVKTPGDAIARPQTVVPVHIDCNNSPIPEVTNQVFILSAVAGSNSPTASPPDELPTYVPTHVTETIITSTEVASITRSENGSHDSASCSSRPPISHRRAQRLRREEDIQISQWQAVQAVRSCFDNAINRVLELRMNAQVPQDGTLLTQGFSQYMNRLSVDDNVENEGILMAISAHGLQSVQTTPLQALNNNIPRRDDDSDYSQPSDFDMPTPEGSPPQPSVIRLADYFGRNNLENHWEMLHNANESPLAIQPEPFQNIGNNSTADDDFINIAVLHAIQSEGLVTSATDFG